jgi:HD-GYP domain-containing protein (c-di-GMP phosphodiesterase class II)
MTALPAAARSYICAVIVAGLVAGGFALPHVTHPLPILGLAVLTILCSSVSEVDGSGSLSMSLGGVVGIAAICITGASGATFVAAASALHYTAGGQPGIKRAFNAAQYAVSGALGGLLFDALHGPVGHLAQSDFPSVIPILMAVVILYSVVNQLLVLGIIYLTQPRSARRLTSQAIPWTSSPYLAYGFLSLLMAALWENFGAPTATLLLIPLVVTRTTFASFMDQRKAYDATIAALIQAVETKDHYTRGHSERVSSGSVMIARQLGLRDDKVKALRYAGMLHDVGKMGVPTRVLQKQGTLTVPEADAVRAHPARGLEMLGDIEFLQEALSGIYHHHERMDGKGYPLGLKGMEIPEFARVIMVADAFDSMTSNRSYRPAMSIEAAIDELVACSGVQFDPTMVQAMVGALHEHGWRVQGAAESRLPIPAREPVVPGQPTSGSAILPRRIMSAYSSVESES